LEVDWGARVDALDTAFGPSERFDTTHRHEIDADTLVARVMSTSYIAPLAPEARDELATKVRELVAPLGDRFELPYVTTAWAFDRS